MCANYSRPTSPNSGRLKQEYDSSYGSNIADAESTQFDRRYKDHPAQQEPTSPPAQPPSTTSQVRHQSRPTGSTTTPTSSTSSAQDRNIYPPQPPAHYYYPQELYQRDEEDSDPDRKIKSFSDPIARGQRTDGGYDSPGTPYAATMGHQQSQQIILPTLSQTSQPQSQSQQPPTQQQAQQPQSGNLTGRSSSASSSAGGNQPEYHAPSGWAGGPTSASPSHTFPPHLGQSLGTGGQTYGKFVPPPFQGYYAQQGSPQYMGSFSPAHSQPLSVPTPTGPMRGEAFLPHPGPHGHGSSHWGLHDEQHIQLEPRYSTYYAHGPPAHPSIRGQPSAPRPPPLVRTSALAQASSSWSLGGYGASGYDQNPSSQTKAVLTIDGDLGSMTQGWDMEEQIHCRRLVLFERVQEGPSIRLKFRPIHREEYDSQHTVISCIYWKEKDEYYVTSVDCITLLELIINQRFSIEEKNRVRRNLEVCKPLTVSKTKPELTTFFHLIMKFEPPRPRNIEKDVKVFLWSMLGSALSKIVSKYSANYFPGALG